VTGAAHAGPGAAGRPLGFDNHADRPTLGPARPPAAAPQWSVGPGGCPTSTREATLLTVARRRRRLLLAAVPLLLASVPAAVAAKGQQQDRVAGVEEPGQSDTGGTFVGIARGPLPGVWRVTVDHRPLAAAIGGSARVTGGSFGLTTLAGGDIRHIAGTVQAAGGTIVTRATGAGCRNQTYAVVGGLTTLSGRRWRLAVTLTHHRLLLLGRCLTIGATVRGWLALGPA